MYVNTYTCTCMYVHTHVMNIYGVTLSANRCYLHKYPLPLLILPSADRIIRYMHASTYIACLRKHRVSHLISQFRKKKKSWLSVQIINPSVPPPYIRVVKSQLPHDMMPTHLASIYYCASHSWCSEYAMLESNAPNCG